MSFTSPCTLPLLPGYVSYVSNLSHPSDLGGVGLTMLRRRVRSGALLFTVGFSAVFTALGATSSALGLLLVQNQRLLNVGAGAFIIVMGLAMTGLITVPLLDRQLRPDLSRVTRGPAGALPLGAAFAFGWTPCVGPVLASILATAAGTATVVEGAVLLLTYSLGLAVPFLLVAHSFARGGGGTRWLQRHSRRIEIGGGLLLVVMGVAVLTGGWTVVMSRVLAAYARLGWPPI